MKFEGYFDNSGSDSSKDSKNGKNNSVKNKNASIVRAKWFFDKDDPRNSNVDWECDEYKNAFDIENNDLEFTLSKELENAWQWPLNNKKKNTPPPEEDNTSKDEKKEESSSLVLPEKKKSNKNDVLDLELPPLAKISDPLYSYMEIDLSKCKVTCSGNPGAIYKIHDKNFDTYWDGTTSGKKHWIQFEFRDVACVSGLAYFANWRRDTTSYYPSSIKLLAGMGGIDENEEKDKDGKDKDKKDKDKDKDKSLDPEEGMIELVHKMLPPEHNGYVTVDVNEESTYWYDQRDYNNGLDTRTDKNEELLIEQKKHPIYIQAHKYGFIRCKVLKIELSHWYPEDRINPSSTSTRYARCRQIMVYSVRSHEYDKQIRDKFISQTAILQNDVWHTRDVLKEIEDCIHPPSDDDENENDNNNSIGVGGSSGSGSNSKDRHRSSSRRSRSHRHHSKHHKHHSHSKHHKYSIERIAEKLTQAGYDVSKMSKKQLKKIAKKHKKKAMLRKMKEKGKK